MKFKESFFKPYLSALYAVIILFTGVFLYSQEVMNPYTNGFVSLDKYGYKNITNGSYGPPSFQTIKNIINRIIPESSDFEKNIFIVVTYKNIIFQKGHESTSNKIAYIIYKKDGAFSQYITDENYLDELFYDRNVYVFMIGDFALSDSYHISIKRLDDQKQPKYTLLSTLDQIVNADNMNTTVSNNAGVPFKLLKMERKSLFAPCTLEINFEDDTNYDFNFYHLDYVFYKMGLAAYNYSDSTNSYFTAAATLLFEFHPFGGINFDSFESHSQLIEDPVRYEAAKFIQRFGIVAGTSISLNQPPFDSLYLGLSYSLNSAISLNGGLVWYKVINRDRISFGPQEYYPPGLFLGFSADLTSAINSIVSILKLN